MIGAEKARLGFAGKPAAWVAAALVAVAVHVGVVFLSLWPFERAEPTDEMAGSLVVELAPMSTSSRIEPLSAPLGAQSSEQAESQPTMASNASDAATDTPIVPPTPTEPEPDLAFQRTDDKKVEAAEMSEKAIVEKREQASEASTASVATAPPKIDAPMAAMPTAPEIGLSPLAARAKTTWNKKIGTHLERFKRYPEAARKQSAEGTVLVSFAVMRDGTIRDAKVIKTSGVPILDGAALEMLARASPLPTAPDNVSGEAFTFAVPLKFEVRKD